MGNVCRLIPIVFAAISNQAIQFSELPPNVTGRTTEQSFGDYVKIARALVPQLRQLALAGDPIEGLDGPFPADARVFHAGTARGADGRVVTSGGRVLTVCALGDGLDDAARRAYEAVPLLSFRGMQYRRDIGKKP